jgi:enoyl-CoA hydratase
MIDYRVDDKVGVITLNRPEQRNAQSPAFLRQLNDAWMQAASDRAVVVIVLRAEGPHFSAGHDLDARDDPAKGLATQRGIENYYDFEYRTYFGYTRSWRAIPKPSIAAVQGACVAAGLMLAWPCDLIVAAENAYFSDPVLRMGVGGIEYHAHAFEFGPRRAKEMLFTASRIGAEEAYRLDMVSRVVPLAELDAETMSLAREIAKMDPFALAQAKRAVNLAMDAQQYVALEANFDNHWTGHHHASAVQGGQAKPLASHREMISANKD